MKTYSRIALVLIVLAIATALPAGACDWACGFDSHLERAVCLVFPYDDGPIICIEINLGPIHTCYYDLFCKNGFPIP